MFWIHTCSMNLDRVSSSHLIPLSPILQAAAELREASISNLARCVELVKALVSSSAGKPAEGAGNGHSTIP